MAETAGTAGTAETAGTARMADAADGPPGAGASMLGAIRTQVMWNRLVAVVEEQAQALQPM